MASIHPIGSTTASETDTRADELGAGLGEDARQAIARAVSTADEAGEDCAARGVAIARVVRELGLDADAVICALVLPAHEEGGLTVALATERFGQRVANLLGGVTRMAAFSELTPADAGTKSAPVQVERLRNLLIALVEDIRSVLIKLAEHLCALRAAKSLEEPERAALARASFSVYAPLASRLGVRQVKWEIEDSAFKESEPDTYVQIARALHERRGSRETYIGRVVDALRDKLTAAGLAPDVAGRPKHIYSIWRKMRAKHLTFDEVFDLRAVRVLVDDVAGCYLALGVVHALWPHIPKEFDDYITNPKPNGYQSLHTAVHGPEGRVLEVQIRTRDMHADAELGVAAHWRYKEAGAKGGSDLEARIAWLRQLLEWHDTGDSASDLLEHLDTELLSDRVYVLTPRGRILDLPQGATALDFAYQVHTDIGHRCRGAKVNGQMVQLHRALQSGDQVEVLTTRQGAPSRDWLNENLGYLRTPRARAKVRHWFRLQDYDRNLTDGHDALNREVKRLGVPALDREVLFKRFNFKKFEDLLAAIGRGDVSHGQLGSALQAQVPAPEIEDDAAPVVRPRRARRVRNDVEVGGIGNLLTQTAQCCKPVPPEPIAGFITRGRGVTVHRRDCRNLLRLEVEDRARVIDVTWAEMEGSTYPVSLEVMAYDRHGLLRDITQVIANEKVNVAGIGSKVNRREQISRIEVTVEVADLGQLSRLMDRIGQLANVTDVRRAG